MTEQMLVANNRIEEQERRLNLTREGGREREGEECVSTSD